MKFSILLVSAASAGKQIPDACRGTGIFDISQCLTEGAIATSVAEYQNQLDAAADNIKLADRLERKKDYRLSNARYHVIYYMHQFLNSVARCGNGFNMNFTDAFYDEMRKAASSNSADEMFAVWNLFAVQTLTGPGVNCNWYDPVNGVDDAIEDSSFPCRTRRLFLKMKGKTQYGQYIECNPADFDIDENVLFR